MTTIYVIFYCSVQFNRCFINDLSKQIFRDLPACEESIKRYYANAHVVGITPGDKNKLSDDKLVCFKKDIQTWSPAL